MQISFVASLPPSRKDLEVHFLSSCLLCAGAVLPAEQCWERGGRKVQAVSAAWEQLCPICTGRGCCSLTPSLCCISHLKSIDAAASRDCSSCKVFLKPLCNLSFAGNVDKAFCCLFFDPRAQYCKRFQTSPDPEVFICKAEQVGDRRQVLPNMLKIDALRWYNILLVCAFI